eukprot:3936879-Rhodomonas_salina.1
MLLRTHYAVPSTELLYAATRYAVSGNELGYAATRCPVLSWGMLLQGSEAPHAGLPSEPRL